ncbi:MAG TPA: hypothetical protein VMR77_02090 [Patescibacteria group bacterium]|nr:hypothetical protein [Patescibacteria group bacterium]
MGSAERQERRGERDFVRSSLFLKMTNKLLSRFVPLTEQGGGIILPPLVVHLKRKGGVTIAVSGNYNEHGFLETGRVHLVVNGKQKTYEVSAVGILHPEMKAYPDMKVALKAMQTASWYYRKSDLPRRTAA